MANLTKRDLMVRISSETGIVQSDVCKVLQAAMALITEALAEGRYVELRNFGIFEVKVTGERVGRNPNKPGTRYQIPPRASVRFRMGKEMREKVAHLAEDGKLEQLEKK